jgi:hypothetical protein
MIFVTIAVSTVHCQLISRPIEFHEPVYGSFIDEIDYILHNDSAFQSFKSDQSLSEIFRVLFASTILSSDIQWTKIVQYIISNNRQCQLSVTVCLIQLIQLSEQEHLVGNPVSLLIEFEEFSIKSTHLLLRYFFDASIMQMIFNTDFSGKNIIEIGGGYGGMAVTMSSLSTLASYKIVDLNNVLQLQQKYISAINHTFPITSIATDSNVNVTSDFLFSIFCIAEQRAEVVQKYVNQYVAHSTSGYFLLNYGRRFAIALNICTEMEIFEMIYKVQPSAIMLPPLKLLGSLGESTRIIWGAPLSIV